MGQSSRETEAPAELSQGFHPPACLDCGACCFSPAEFYVPVTGDDWSRLGSEVEQWTHWRGNQAFMRMTNGHCAALAVETTDHGLRFVCQVYDRRPQTCRDLARGSVQCEADLILKAPRHGATSSINRTCSRN